MWCGEVTVIVYALYDSKKWNQMVIHVHAFHYMKADTSEISHPFELIFY